MTVDACRPNTQVIPIDGYAYAQPSIGSGCQQKLCTDAEAAWSMKNIKGMVTIKGTPTSHKFECR